AKAVDHAVNRAQDRRARLHEQVNSQMDGPAIECAAPFRLEDIADIHQACFIIAANGHRGIARFHLIEDSTAEPLYIPEFRHIRKIRAANTQIQDDLLAAPQICFDNRPYLSRVFLDPGSGSIASGAWPKPTSVSQSIVRKVRVYGCE